MKQIIWSTGDRKPFSLLFLLGLSGFLPIFIRLSLGVDGQALKGRLI
jgi:hypothetical protein